MQVRKGELAKVMADKGMDREALASLLGVHVQTITNIRSGRPVKRTVAIAVAAVLGAKVDQLFTDEAVQAGEAA